MTRQPEWTCVGHIGDRDPIAHGGGYIYQDTTGSYRPELVWFEPESDDEWHKTEGATKLQVYRIALDPPRFKTFAHGNCDESKLADPTERGKTWVWHSEWYVRDLQSVADTCGTTKLALMRELMSTDPETRASGYYSLIGHFGAFEFDQYPLEMTEDEAYTQYADEMKLSLAS